MKNRSRYYWILALTLLAVPAYGTSLLAFADDAETEQTIARKDLPKVIQDAIKGVEVDGIELETEDGKQVYEITFKVDDAEFELELSASGQLLGVEIKHEDDEDSDEGADDEEDN